MSHAILVGSSDPIMFFRAFDTDGTAKVDLASAEAGLTLSVYRTGGSSVTISSLSDKAADDTAHADGAIRQVGSGNLYTVDAPDAAVASQFGAVSVKGSYTAGVIEGVPHPLVGYDGATVAVGANTVVPPAASVFAGITILAEWLGLMAGKQVADATALAEIKTSGAGAGAYSELTDSLEAIADNAGGLSPANIASIVAGVQAVSEDVASPLSVNVINVTEGDQWQIVITGLGTLANNTNLIFMLKHNRNDADSAAVIAVDKTTGLLTVQGTTWGTASDATLVVDDESAGDVTITVKSAASKKVKSATYADALKSLRSSANGGDITYRPKGETIVSEGPINTAT